MVSRLRVTITGSVGVLALLIFSLTGKADESGVQANMQAYMAARTAAYRDVNIFSFGVFSDIHMSGDNVAVYSRAQWQTLLTRWRDLGHLFGVIVGDLGYGQPAHIENVLSGPLAVPSAPPVFYTMGNHELSGIGKRAWIDALYPGAVNPASWTVHPSLAPGNADHIYWSFDIGPYTHFIMLDGDQMIYDGLNAYPRQRFGQTQLAWLANDIRANATKNLMVFVHEPIDQQLTGFTPYYTLNDKAALVDLLSQHPKQVYVFSGHFHNLQGITKWRGITSVHVQQGNGVRVTVGGEQITVSDGGTVTNFDLHPMNQVQTVGTQRVVQVAEDGTNSGNARDAVMTVVGPENGVTPSSGSLMLKSERMTWYSPKFISEQLVKIVLGMKFSFDIFLLDVVDGMDAVTVQPDWYMLDSSIPPPVIDQNGIVLSRRPRDATSYVYNEDVPKLGGRATGRWYHREFDLSGLAGNYVDGLYLTSGAGRVNVGKIYVDNIKFTWPVNSSSNSAPSVALTSPVNAQRFTAPANITVTASPWDSDGTIVRVDAYANSTLIGSRTASPYSFAWSGVPAGTYAISAVATDNLGATATSAPVTITVDPATPSASSSATFVRLDTTTQGNWVGKYGGDGRTIVGDTTALPSFARVLENSTPTWTWSSTTSEMRALARASGSGRIAATWYASSTFTIDVNLLDGGAHHIALYCLDWDNQGRSQRIEILDAASGAVLDSRTVSGFVNGDYLVWEVRGNVKIRAVKTAGPNAVISALFFDSGTSTQTPTTTSSAAFVRVDTATQGNWQGVYGQDGRNIVGDTKVYPSYAMAQENSVLAWTWASSTTDLRALARGSGTGRLAATWYAPSSFTIDVNISDGKVHKIALYCLDWDNQGRAQRIDVLDAANGTVLDSRVASAFTGGQYLVWNVGGNIKFRVVNTSGPNAVVSGLFFGPP